MKILIVEDDPQSADLVTRLFHSIGHTVVHTLSGFEGLRLARTGNFDVILLDFHLPDLDGSQVGLVLHPVLKNTPIIALTAQADSVTRQKAKLFGFSAFIAKPWNLVELVSTVQDLYEKSQQRKTRV
jgi:two-component system copper resistance phosphate regulon response regulator CusR